MSATGLRVSGRSPDGLVEAIELDDRRRRAGPDARALDRRRAMASRGDRRDRRGPAVAVRRAGAARLASAVPERSPGRQKDAAATTASPSRIPTWPERFEAEAARIVAALPPRLEARIDHVGSTAVPDLAGQADRRHAAVGHRDGRRATPTSSPSARSATAGCWTHGTSSTSTSAATWTGNERSTCTCAPPGRRGRTAPRVPRLAARPPRGRGRVRGAQARAGRRPPEGHARLHRGEDGVHHRASPTEPSRRRS